MLDEALLQTATQNSLELNKFENEARRRLCAQKFLPFVLQTTPYFKAEYCHYVIAEYLEAVEAGEIDRLLISLSPRASKSTMVSKRFPGWCLGRKPTRKIMLGSHTTDLARMFGREVRNLIPSTEFQAIFPGLRVSRDSTAAHEWRCFNENDVDFHAVEAGTALEEGEFYAFGTGTGIAGHGFNIGILDDAISEQDRDSKVTKDKIWSWYPAGFLSRGQPEENAIIVMATRWCEDDLTGHLLQEEIDRKEADKWEKLIIPAILDEDTWRKMIYICGNIGLDATKDISVGGSFAPRRFSDEFIARRKANMPKRDFDALYMQKPTSDEGNILKRAHWRLWADNIPSSKSGEDWEPNPLPKCHTIIQCYDTAYEEGEENDFSARTTWGLFEWDNYGRDDPVTNVILLDRWKERVEFPELTDEVVRSHKKMKPDLILVEKKASGASLVQELRRQNLPIEAWLPPGTKGNKGKVPRAHAASITLRQGAVWYCDREWAMEVIDECAAFRGTGGQVHDDLTDTVTMILIYLRRHYWLDLDTDDRARDPDIDIRAESILPRKRFYGGRRRSRPTGESLH